MNKPISYDIKCQECKRYLATTTKSVDMQIKCSSSSCKKLLPYKIVMLSDYIKTHNHKEAK